MNERTQSKKGIFQAKSAKLVDLRLYPSQVVFTRGLSHRKIQKMLCKITVKFLFILKGI